MLVLALSFTSFVGTTFAWFTDSVTSSNNIIVSGNLDVELYYQNDETSGWTKVDANTNVFKANTLWEPGHTEVVKLKVVNEGSLTLKYNLGVNVASETGSVNVAGEDFYLSNYIKYGIVDGAQTYTREQAVVAVEATATKLNQAYNSGVTALEAKNDTNSDEKVVTMVVYMPQEVGNEANFAKDAAKPVINLGINLLATQYTYEEDSFNNQYDKEAGWNGVIPATMPESLVLEPADRAQDGGKVIIKDTGAFVYMNKLVEYFEANATQNPYNHYYYNMNWSVELDADVNLMNVPVDPIYMGYFGGGFDGKGHTISNVVVKNGQPALFNNKTNHVNNLTVKNIVVNAPNASVVGSVSNYAAMNNVHVENATVIGGKYVGGLVGKGSSFINCSVKNSTVVASDKTVGGLVGYCVGDPGVATVTGNVVENVNVTATYNVGGMFGQAQNAIVEGNTVKNVTVTSTTALPANASSNEVRAAEVAARSAFANTTIGANTVENVKLVSNVSTTAEVEAAIKEGQKNIVLAEGTYALSASSDVTFVGAGKDTVIDLDGAIGNANISNATVTGATNIDVDAGETAVFENVVFDAKLGGASSGQYGSISGSITFKGCTFEKFLHFDSTHGANILIEDCTFGVLGSLKVGAGSTNVEVKNCTFEVTTATSIWGEKGMTIYCPATFTNCEFNNRQVLAGSNGLSLTFNSCTMNGGTPVYYVDNTDGIIRGGNIPNVTINN